MYGTVIILMLCSALIHAEQACYPPCGCFSDDPPFEDRPLTESPEDIRLFWLLYTDMDSEPVEIRLPEDGSEIVVPPEFDASKPTQFVIHGWLSVPDNFNYLRRALLQNTDSNVVVVDWSWGASWGYDRSAANTRTVGYCSASVARTLYGGPVNSTHCIGHSLGAHTCGYMGLATEGALGRISGLDPATTGFLKDDVDVKLEKTDAQFNDNIFTTWGEGADGYPEARKHVGHVDFFPNNANHQPGCGDDGNCDHWEAVWMYADSLYNGPECFPSRPCDSYDDSNNCLCEDCVQGVDCQSMGFYSPDYPGRGTFFVRTEEWPRCEVWDECQQH